MPNVQDSLGHLLNTRHCDAMALLERQRVVCGLQGNDGPFANGHGLQMGLEVQRGWLIRKRALEPAENGEGGFKSEVQHLSPRKVRRCKAPTQAPSAKPSTVMAICSV